jgi:plasmid maintenance system antidote protein VapI
MRAKDITGKWAVHTPHKLFDHIRETYNLKTDAALAHMLSIRTPLISKIRNGVIRITPTVIIAVHEQTNIPIAKIKEMSK